MENPDTTNPQDHHHLRRRNNNCTPRSSDCGSASVSVANKVSSLVILGLFVPAPPPTTNKPLPQPKSNASNAARSQSSSPTAASDIKECKRIPVPKPSKATSMKPSTSLAPFQSKTV